MRIMCGLGLNVKKVKKLCYICISIIFYVQVCNVSLLQKLDYKLKWAKYAREKNSRSPEE